MGEIVKYNLISVHIPTEQPNLCSWNTLSLHSVGKLIGDFKQILTPLIPRVADIIMKWLASCHQWSGAPP